MVSPGQFNFPALSAKDFFNTDIANLWLAINQLIPTNVSTQIVASAGASQGTATATNASQVLINAGVVGGGVIALSSVVVNSSQLFINRSGNDVKVYPPVGMNFSGLGANAPFVVADGNDFTYTCFTAGVLQIL